MRTQIALVSLTGLALSLAFGGCQFGVASTPQPKPDLVKITPNLGYNGEAVPVVIEGHNLKPLITQDVSQPGGLVIDTTFVARLGNHDLAQVVYVDDQHLNAVVPQNIAVGVYPLTVETPAGDSATLANAYTATATAVPVLSAVQPADIVNDAAETLTVTGSKLSPGMTAALEASGLSTVALTVSNLSATSFDALVPAASAAGAYRLTATTTDNVAIGIDNAVTIWAPAELVASVTVSHAKASIGQAITVTVHVANSGGSSSLGVVVGTPVQNGSGAATRVSGPTPASSDIAAGDAVDFVFTYTAQTAGDVTFTAAANGANEFSSRPNNAAAATSPMLTIEPGAALSVQVSVTPLRTPINTSIQLTVDVTNNGVARAQQVAPVILQLPALAALTTGPTPAAVDLSGSATHTFVFDYQAVTAGRFHFEVSAAGVDQNNQQDVTATVVHSADVTVQSNGADLYTAITVPAAVSVGQTFGVDVEVDNSGLRGALGVSTTLTHAPAGSIVQASGPTPASIDISSTGLHVYAYTFTASAPGDVVIDGVAQGTDQASGGFISSPVASSTTIHVQTPPVLAAGWTVPTTLTAGQTFDAVLTVTNSGQATAQGVAPTAFAPTNAVCQPATPAAADIAGGGSATFTYSCVAGASGSTGFAAGAQGSDINSSQPATASAATSGTIVVQSAPALTAIWTGLLTAVSYNQSFTVTLTVTNSGEAGALGVAPGTVVETGSLNCHATTPTPANADIAGSSFQDFVYQCTVGAVSGDATLTVSASGTDANSGGTVNSTTASSGNIAVQRPPVLAASWTVPTSINVSQPFTATLRVVNSGEARANNVGPTGLAANPFANATCTEPPAPAAANIDGNNGETFFVYSCTAGATPGATVTLTAGAAGTDVNSSANVTAAPATSASISLQTPGQLSLAWSSVPTSVTVGQVVNGITLTVTNNGGSTINNTIPSSITVTVVGGTASAICTGPTPNNNFNINAGNNRSWTYNCTFGASAGAVTLSAGASGTDANPPNNPVTAAPLATGTITVQTAPALVGSWSAPPPTVTRTQQFDVTYTVTNNGGASANAVAPTGFTVTGPTNTTCVLQAPLTAAIAGSGGSHGFIYRCTAGNTSGSATLSAGAQGTDANSGATVNAAAVASSAFQVQSAPAFTLAWTVPAAVNRLQTFQATLRVTNSGQATANVVAPTGFTIGGTTGTLCTGPTPANIATLAGAAFADFVYDCTAGNVRANATLTAGATGTDANTTNAVTGAPVTSSNIAVQNPAAITVTSVTAAATQVSQTQTGYAVSMVVANSGEVAANVVSAASWLIFKAGATDVSSEYTITVSGANPTSIAAGGNATFNFTVAVGATATLGTITLDGQANGTDARTGATTSDVGATTTDSWTVVANTPPVGCFSVVNGPVVATNSAVNFDAGCSTDAETATANLQVEWDWNNSGTWTTPTTTKTGSHTYAAAGTFTVALRVTDAGGTHGYASALVVIADSATIIVVNSSADPGTGTCDITECTLREAVALATSRGGVDTITFDPAVFPPATPTTINVNNSSGSITINDAAGVQIIGNRGVWLVYANTALAINSANTVVANLDISGATTGGRSCVTIAAASNNDWFFGNTLRLCDTAISVAGGSNEFGPGNVFQTGNNNPNSINITGGNDQYIHENRFSLCDATCVTMANTTSGHNIERNFFYSSAGRAITVAGSNVSVYHNTFDAVGSGGDDAIYISYTDTALPGVDPGHQVMDNIFSNNANCAINYTSGLTAATSDYNDLFNNDTIGCSAPPAGTHNLNTNPQYVNRGAFNFSLLSNSLCINAGFDVGVDTNGTGPGLYNGSAPDIGADETNY